MANSREITASDVTKKCIGLRMRMANRVITREYDQALRPLGLRVTQLAMLAFAEERKLLHQSDVCGEFQIDDSTLSRNLERMENNGWLEAAEGEDAREHPYRLTSQGRRLLKKALPMWAEAQANVSKMLGADGVNAIAEFAKQQSSKT